MKGLVAGYWRLDGIIRGGNVSGDDVIIREIRAKMLEINDLLSQLQIKNDNFHT